MSIKPPTYNPPDNILAIFNPLEFNVSIPSTGYTTDQLTVINQKLIANQALINAINNKLGTLGKVAFVGSPTPVIFYTATTIPIYSIALAPGVYIFSWNLTWAQSPSYTTAYKWSSAYISMNNQPAFPNYNITIAPQNLSGQVGGSVQLQCYLYNTVAWTFAVNMNITCNPNTATNQWVTGTCGTQYPVAGVSNPNLNSLRIVQILSL